MNTLKTIDFTTVNYMVKELYLNKTVDSNYTYWGEHLITEITVESLHCILETNFVYQLYFN